MTAAASAARTSLSTGNSPRGMVPWFFFGKAIPSDLQSKASNIRSIWSSCGARARSQRMYSTDRIKRTLVDRYWWRSTHQCGRGNMSQPDSSRNMLESHQKSGGGGTRTPVRKRYIEVSTCVAACFALASGIPTDRISARQLVGFRRWRPSPRHRLSRFASPEPALRARAGQTWLPLGSQC